ncbi:LysM peptidoglycan-binding domain-containing protein [Pseudomonas nitroreducens]|uniref:LysM peptidoglycan-binding domain-containing protein n=1 Tax=Pseudomonas nitroreducens TaxID=46680 RepID=UPI003CC83502
MSKVCAKHVEQPAFIYGACVGCELEALRAEAQALREEVAALRARGMVPAYITQPGESVMGIALRQLKDEDRWPEIRDLNADRFADMGPHDYYPPGTVLNMPHRTGDKAVTWPDIRDCLDSELREWTGDHRKAVERALTDANGRIRVLFESAKA